MNRAEGGKNVNKESVGSVDVDPEHPENIILIIVLLIVSIV